MLIINHVFYSSPHPTQATYSKASACSPLISKPSSRLPSVIFIPRFPPKFRQSGRWSSGSERSHRALTEQQDQSIKGIDRARIGDRGSCGFQYVEVTTLRYLVRLSNWLRSSDIIIKNCIWDLIPYFQIRIAIFDVFSCLFPFFAYTRPLYRKQILFCPCGEVSYLVHYLDAASSWTNLDWFLASIYPLPAVPSCLLRFSSTSAFRLSASYRVWF